MGKNYRLIRYPLINKVNRGDYLEIKLNSRKYFGFHAKIDEEDYNLVNKYKWRVYKNSVKHKDAFYATADAYKTKTNEYYPTGNGKRNSNDKLTSITMHRLIMDFPKRPFVVDHINGEGLDNRRHNLRTVRPRTNRINSVDYVKNKRSKTICFNVDNNFKNFMFDYLKDSDRTVSEFARTGLVYYLKNKYPELFEKYKEVHGEEGN